LHIERAAEAVLVNKMESTSMGKREINLGFMSMRHATLPERVAAAARAGFDGISLRADQWAQTTAAGWDAPRIRALLAQHNMRVSEIEPLRFLREDLLDVTEEMVRAFAAPRVQVTPPIDGGPLDFDAVPAWLKKAAARLAGVELAIEFLPTTGVPDAPTAQRLIDRAGGPANLGFCVDSWHVFRGGGLDSIRNIDPKRVFMVQIDDGPMQPTLPDFFPDTLRFRQPCGEGEFDLTGFLALLPGTAPINVEVISEALDKRPPADVAKLLYSSTLATLEKAAQR
jgi:sugar phosphate isomerase/epimerase